MENKVKEQFSSINILSDSDIEYIINMITDIYLGKKEADIRVREFEGKYFFYTFLSRENDNRDRFIFTKYKAKDETDAFNVLSKYIIDKFADYKVEEYGDSVETKAIRYNLVSTILSYFTDDFKEYYSNSKNLIDITEQITDTDFYRNWVLT